MSEKFGLDSMTRDKIRDLFEKHASIDKAILYGSRAMGNFKPGSDIDLTLIAPKLTLTDQLAIEHELDDLLLPYKIDLSLFHQIDNPDLRNHIQRQGVVFYKCSSR